MASKKTKENKIDTEEHFIKQISNPITSGMINILKQGGKDVTLDSQKLLYDEIEVMVDEIKNGNHNTLVTMLVTNTMQLQLLNGTVTQNLIGDVGKALNNFKVLSEIQLKVMQETRKSILAINEITNPKRTTFIKEASQHNHLHQNSEKKDENKNELQKPERLEEIETFSEAEITPLKEKGK